MHSNARQSQHLATGSRLSRWDRTGNQRWRTKRLALLVAAVSVLVLGTGGASYAASYDGTCDAGEVCVYNNANYGGAYSDLPGNYPDMWEPPVYHSYNYPTLCNDWMTAPTNFLWCRLNDSISSIQNHSYSQGLRIFTDAHYRGSSQWIATRTNDNQVTYNDKTSSLKWY